MGRSEGRYVAEVVDIDFLVYLPASLCLAVLPGCLFVRCCWFAIAPRRVGMSHEPEIGVWVEPSGFQMAM